MGDEGSRWGRFFGGTRCFCFGCNSCSRKSFDDEQEPKAEESDEEILTKRPHERQQTHQPLIHQPHKQQKLQFLPLLPKVDSGCSPGFHEKGHDPSGSYSAFSPTQFAGQEECEVKWTVQNKVRRYSLEETVPSFVLPLSYRSCDLLDVHYLEQAQRLLSNVNKWNFNIFVLDWLTNGRSFYYLVLHLFHEYNFLKTFKLDAMQLFRTLRLVELGYCRRNPYHNSLHAADVVQAIHCNLLEDCIAPHLSPLEKMAAIIAAACHDLDHPGVNQSFLISSSHHLAPLYDGVSILEKHHWRGTVSILRESHLFDHLTHLQWNRLRYLLEVLILATDISKQQDILLKFRGCVDAHSLDLGRNEEHRNFILQITLKCADICNPCRPWKVSKKWSQLICEEFFRQGDQEKVMRLPVTVSFDRQQSSTAKIQAGFMSFIVEPLFIEWNKYAPSARSRSMLGNLNSNRFKWMEIEQEEVRREGDENQKRSSTSTVVSFLDWDGDDDDDDDVEVPPHVALVNKNLLPESRRSSDLSKKLGSRKSSSSSSSFGSKFKLKAPAITAEKENFNPSIMSVRGSEILTVSKSSLSSSIAPRLKTGEKRRLSLPVSKQAPTLPQAVDHRRASLPLARILEIGSTNLSVGCGSSRGGWSLMTNASSGQLESLSELSPPVDEAEDSGSCEPRGADNECLKCAKDELKGKKYERLKCKFSFDSGQPPDGSKAEMERSESFTTACYKKQKKYQHKICHHYSEMVLSLCHNRYFESKKRRSSCPLADAKALNNNNISGCQSSNHNRCSQGDEGYCRHAPPSKVSCNKGDWKREDHHVTGEGRTAIPLSELKLHNVNPYPATSGRNRRFASLTEEIEWPKFRPSKKRAKSLVTSSLAEDGSIICQTHLLRDTDDADRIRRDGSTSPGCSSSSTTEKSIKKNIFITLQSNSKEIFTKLMSSGANNTPSCNSARNNSVPLTSSSRLPGTPFKSSPAILRFNDGHLRSTKQASKKASSIRESGSQDDEIVLLLPKS